ncbi:4Fe-4S binding protein [Halarsenatibacter silvermanii]|uniref:4Fe-4S dicluster domain-containing protein n=1 Tax=Halarsenatibacter silvermanii TaxID=321763 RepID=A0A1G9I423_9FIRM|nr:(Fe-S)-binding protein [Halarsenatibacter silvermanii]SDL19795.1 4Fe-4S dicluster domain-containing protein [Halarsenatibacter silvermanii]
MSNSYKQITEELREVAGQVLEEHDIKHLVGFAPGMFSELIEPVFIDSPEQAEKLSFTADASPMLAKYIHKYHPARQAVVAKPCDSRAMAYYMSEDLMEREDLVVIGINGCPGIDGNSACDECDTRNPVIADYTVGEEMDQEEIEAELAENSYLLEEVSPEERKKHYQEEFSRCTQCYACRDACPVCYCDHCFVESNQPEWLREGSDTENDMVFHLMRTMHMPGRCVNCGACEMACPEGIEMRSLTSHLYHKARDLYDYRPGMDPDQLTLYSDYDKDDEEPGFLD